VSQRAQENKTRAATRGQSKHQCTWGSSSLRCAHIHARAVQAHRVYRDNAATRSAASSITAAHATGALAAGAATRRSTGIATAALATGTDTRRSQLHPASSAGGGVLLDFNDLLDDLRMKCVYSGNGNT